jgi:hypothetical protein
MAEEAVKPDGAPVLPVSKDYPGPEFPALYADTVSSVQPGIYTTKFYLARLEPNMKAENTHLTQPFVQIIMPTVSFVDAAAFFGRMVQQLIESGTIDQSAWDQAVANYKNLSPKRSGQ